MKSKTQLTQAILALLLLTTTATKKDTLFNTRVLQNDPPARQTQTTFGSYEITTELSSTCDDYSESEIQYTEDEFNEGHESIKGYFTWLQEPLRKFIKEEDDSDLQAAGKKNGWVLGFNMIFALVSFVMTFVFLIYFFCMGLCACLCCCCDDELEKDLADKPGDTEMKRRKKARMRRKREKKIKQLKSKGCTACIVITSLALVLAISVLGIVWSVYIFNSIGGIQRSDCASSYFFSHIRLGVSNDELTFIGLGGIKHLFEGLRSNVDELSAGNNIPAEQLDQKAELLLPSLETFYNTFNTQTVTSCTGVGTATPDSISSLTPTIIDFIETEYQALKDGAIQIHEAAVTANELAGSTGQAMKDSLDAFILEIVGADDSIVKFQTTYRDTVNTEQNSAYAKSFAWIIMLSTFGLMIFFLVLMGCSLNATCTGCFTCLEAILAILKMFFAFIINLLAITSVVVGVVTVNFCVLSYDSLNDKQLGAELFPTDIKKIFDVCLYADSSGNVFDLLDADQIAELDQITKMAEGFSFNLDDFNITFTEPPSIKIYREELLAKWKSYELGDFESSPADDPQVQLDSGNPIVDCTQDEWQVFQGACTRSPISQLADAANANLAGTYCLVPSLFTPTDGTQRYGAGDCAASAAATLTNLKACVDSHDGLIDSMDAAIIAANGPKETAVDIYTSLSTVKPEFESIQVKLQETVDFISATTENLPAILNCKVFRSEMRTMLGNVCYRFTRPFTIQGIILCIIGPLMTILSFCVCCTYMKSKIADDLDDLKKAKKKEVKNNHRQPMPPMQQQYQPPMQMGYGGPGHRAPAPPGYY